MGELLLCNEPIAALPYYIEGISWNVYSIEELCYYIENNTYLVEKDFMCEELCTWLEKEVHHAGLAGKLRNIMQVNGRLSDFVLTLLMECGYCSRDSVKEICRILREMEEKSDFECNKVRADRLMEKEKYLSSIYEYKNLLDSDEAGEQPKALIGNIWHNLGTAYANLFQFSEAIVCYRKAYERNHHSESVRECLVAYRCLRDEEGFLAAAEEYNVSDTTLSEIQNEIMLHVSDERLQQFDESLKELERMYASGDKKAYQKKISGIILNWKEEYRRICKI